MTAGLWSFSSALGSDAADLREMSVEAVDGSLGKVKDVVDQIDGAYLVVDTGPWVFGKTVTLPAGVVTAVDTDRRCVFIDRSKDDVKNAPEHDPDAPDDTHHRDALTAYYTAERERETVVGPISDADNAASAAGMYEGADPAPATPTQGGSGRLGGLTGESPGSERGLMSMPGGDLDAAQPTGVSPSERPLGSSPESERLAADAAPASGVISSERVGGAPADLSPDEHETRDDSSETAAVESRPTNGADAQLSAELASPASEEEQPALTHESSSDLTEEASARPEEGASKRRFARDTSSSPSEAASKSSSGRSRGGGTSRAWGDDMPIARYDSLTAAQVIARLRNLSQRELGTVARYEKGHADRQTILRRIESLREREPWQGYDDATVDEIKKKLADADEDRAKAVRDYERRHRDRKGVMEAARRTVAAA